MRPLHYDADGAPIGDLALEPFIGPARVVDVSGAGPLVTVADIEVSLGDCPPRVLLRTYARAPDGWDDDLKGIEPAVIDRLA